MFAGYKEGKKEYNEKGEKEIQLRVLLILGFVLGMYVCT